MKKILFLSLLVPFFSFAEIWVDYEPAEQVTEMTVVKVKANMLDDYLMGIKRTWVDSCEIQKELGHIVGCAVYTASTAGTDPNVFLTITYENLVRSTLHIDTPPKKMFIGKQFAIFGIFL